MQIYLAETTLKLEKIDNVDDQFINFKAICISVSTVLIYIAKYNSIKSYLIISVGYYVAYYYNNSSFTTANHA